MQNSSHGSVKREKGGNRLFFSTMITICYA